MRKIHFPIKSKSKGKKVADLQEVLLFLLKKRRELFTPPPVPTHVVPHPNWDEIVHSLKKEYQKWVNAINPFCNTQVATLSVSQPGFMSGKKASMALP